MTFAYPEMLYATGPLLAGLVLFLAWAWRKKQRLIAEFVQSRLLADLTVGVSHSRQILRMGLLVGAVASLLIALARPQGGLATDPTPQHGTDILIAIDTSRSLLARDLEPSRIQRAKLGAWELAQAGQGNRLGLIAFTSEAFLQCPLTLDLGAFRQNLDAIQVGILPKHGSSIAEAIHTAQESLRPTAGAPRALVIFSDGEEHQGDAVEAATTAAQNGLRVFTVGVGTRKGELIPVQKRNDEEQYLRDSHGNPVKTRLNASHMKEIAAAGKGFYLPLQETGAMETLYKKGLAPLPKIAFESTALQRRQEYFHPFAVLGLLLLLAELFIPDQRRGARSEPSSAIRSPAVKHGQAGALLAIATLICTVTSPVLALSPRSALKAYNAGDYASAQSQFAKLAQRSPQDARLHYNLGAAAYKSQSYGVATKAFQRATKADQLELQQRAYYNLGNTLFQHGKQQAAPAQQAALWKKAIQSYKNTLALDPKNKSVTKQARHNLRYVREKLDALKKKHRSSKDPSSQEKKQQKDPSKKNKPQKGEQRQSQKEDRSTQDPSQKKSPNPQDSRRKKEQGRSQPSSSQQPKSRGSPKEGGTTSQPDASTPTPGESAQGQEKSDVSIPEGKMTAAEARRFLDALRQHERSLVFTNKIPSSRANVTKEW